MASKRETPQLNLAPELPQVLSNDFNLFYTPQAEPVDKTVDIFTKSLDNFVNGAGTAMVINAEKREKQVNEAEALKSYEENKMAFNDAVEKGLLPKEVNPYFVDKYKELHLNKKAEEFKIRVYQEYARNNVKDDTTAEGFDNFYKIELEKFIKENSLGTYDALKLEQGFFSKTSKTRASLLEAHAQGQLAKISEDYKVTFKETIQTFFDANKSMEEIGKEVSEFVLDKTNNGLGKTTARTYLLESLMEYAERTGDLDFAEKLLRELPKNIQLGTDVIFNVKAIGDDLNIIKEKIDERITNRDKDEAVKIKNRRDREAYEASDFADQFETFSDAKQSPEFSQFSRYKKEEIEKEFNKRGIGFSSQTNPDVEGLVDDKLKVNDFEGAMQTLRENMGRVTANYYNKKKDEIKNYVISGTDGLLSDDDYELRKEKLQTLVDQQVKGKIASISDPLVVAKFEKRMIAWLSSNPLDGEEFKGNRQKRFDAFNDYNNKVYMEYYNSIVNDSNVTLDNSVSVPSNVNPNDVSIVENNTAVTTKTTAKKETADKSKLKVKPVQTKGRNDNLEFKIPESTIERKPTKTTEEIIQKNKPTRTGRG